MDKPFIGVSMSRDEQVAGAPRDWIRKTYILAVVGAGALPILLPNESQSLELLEYCDGLLLTGGGDFDPESFGATDEGTDYSGVSKTRDEMELAFIRAAERMAMPVLGICRGAQALAVAGGGTLIQDIPRVLLDSPLVHSQAEKRQQPTHKVVVEPQSQVAKLLGGSVVEVNSFHHQAIARIPRGYIVTARAEDGVIEAIENPDKEFMVGVQWHPEDLVGNSLEAQKLFAGFVESSRQYRERGQRYGTASH
ncbi:MAG: gamma-glutamyl-gamma-aminobutyrate hydrolase family protein [Firmicutes bacterium]|nr:gamma-glutamyl-gamma-aminobutyrate hydrolase family protein [Bacillota bacterium]MCL5971396.1 gamma-glutamyl-gamma-aminobutyrate hydrolase family protein [Bacillota bacterium]